MTRPSIAESLMVEPSMLGTDPAHQSPEVPVQFASGERRGCWWLGLGLMIVGMIVAGVMLFPLIREELKQRKEMEQAIHLVTEAQDQLLAGQLDAAESSAHRALELVPRFEEAEKMLASTKALRERDRRRGEAGVKALAAAEKLAAGDDIPAALAAFRKIRGRSSDFGEAAAGQAEQRIGELSAVTATLRFSADWPPDAVLEMDGNPVTPEGGTLTGILLGVHRFQASRVGYRPQALIELRLGGAVPVDFPQLDWRMIGGRVVITSTPTGAAVWIRGKDSGKTTPCTLEEVDVGDVSYLLKLKDHVDAALSGKVENMETLELAATLTEKPRLPEPGKKAGERREFNLTPELRVAFRWCPAGKFVMGSAARAASKREKPTRLVELTDGYWMAETEFSQRQWAAVLGHQELLRVLLMTGAGSVKVQLDHPMQLASWDLICGNNERSGGLLGKINAYLSKNKVAGWEADLPTEAQWEYACRAGTRSWFGTADQSAAGVDRIAWHRGNSGGHLQKVGQKDANAWGLRDMHGNIAEWCRDWFADTYEKQATRDPAGPTSGWKKCLRGGSWLSTPWRCGSAVRMEAYSSTSHPAIGFRLMLRNGKPKPPAGAPDEKPLPK